jgi:hypothetical protein
MLLDFIIELCSIPTALLPPLQKVWLVGIEETGFFARFAPFREGLSSDEATNGFPAGSGSHEHGSPFQVVAMEKEAQTHIMHHQRF